MTGHRRVLWMPQGQRWWYRSLALALFVLFALSGCAQLNAAAEKLPFQPLLSGPQLGPFTSPGDRARFFILTNEQDIKAMTENVWGEALPLNPVPSVLTLLRTRDFTKEFAILVDGPNSGGNVSITVDTVTRQSGQVTINAIFDFPGAGERTLPAEAKPFHLIVIPKDDGWGEAMMFQLVVNGKTIARTIHTVP